MKSTKAFLTTSIIVIILGGVFLYYVQHSKGTLPSFINTHTSNKKYIIKKAGKVIKEADTLEEAVSKASQIKRSIAINTYDNTWVYSDLYPFMIITDNGIHDFISFNQAIQYAKKYKYQEIYYKTDTNVIWTTNIILKDKLILDVPVIKQLPELPRGCEVTSLAMLLKYRSIDVDKMQLAKEVKKDLTPYSVDSAGKIHYGNPYEGFVGDMYDKSKNGYGVYHGPIAELARQYSKNAVADLTGLEFEEILYMIQIGNPVWVITNITYDVLEDSYFNIWHTPTGIVKTTNRLHSVVITGFSKDQIYINDPLRSEKNISVDREKFKKAWEQMGNQAIIILN